MINIKDLILVVQRKIAAVNSSTSVDDLENLYKLAKVLDGSMSAVYDSDGQLPDATSASTQLAYIRNNGRVKINNGKWDTISPGGAREVPPPPPTREYGGITSGFAFSGWANAPVALFNQFSFTSDGNATNLGTTDAYAGAAGASSITHGYKSGGNAAWFSSTIDKFAFALPATVTKEIGNLTAVRNLFIGGNMNSLNAGYVPGGVTPPNTYLSSIDKYPFASDTNASVVGQISEVLSRAVSHSSPTHGYVTAGFNATGATPYYRTTIRKFPFAADGNTVDTVALGGAARMEMGGAGDANNGFTIGGATGSGNTRSIRSFSYSNESTQIAFNQLTWSLGGNNFAGASSTTFGYAVGGYASPPGIWINNIEKFPFAATGSVCTDVGDLTSGVSHTGTAQV